MPDLWLSAVFCQTNKKKSLHPSIKYTCSDDVQLCAIAVVVMVVVIVDFFTVVPLKVSILLQAECWQSAY